MCFFLIAKFLILATLMGITQAINITFNFTSFPEQVMNNDLSHYNSTVAKNAIQVTYDLSGSIANQSGRVFFKDQFQLWTNNKNVQASFNTTFVFNILNKTAQPGEGLAFILSANKDLPEKSEGQWLGIVNSRTNGTNLAQIVSIEFDTKKSYDQDINGNHVGLNVNSINSIRQVPLTNVTLSNGADITVQVRYDGKNMTVFVGNMENPVLSEPIVLSEYLPEKVFVGFSASTGDDTQLNCVKSWAFNGSDIDEGSKGFWVRIVVVVLAVGLLFGVAFYLCWRRCKSTELDDDIEGQINGTNLAPRKFRLRELKKATGNFIWKNQLGRGGFGTVYKGIWRNKEIAVKRVSETSRHGKQQFIAEVTTIGSLRHRNLVKLIGWCYERYDFLLVYEYMPNGSLDKFIFYDEKSGREELMLTWEMKLSVIHGTAQALDYLHNGSEKRILHRDIKSSNIMLDSEFNARLGDFGLARTIQENQKTHHSTKEIAGTPGYMAPESFLIGRATVETEVYAFGVLIMEVASGRKPGNQTEENNYNNSIVHWLWELRRKGRILDAADSRLDGEFSEKEMECVLLLGLACCHPNPHLRPSMKTVLQVLSWEADPPVVPPERPPFMWPAMPPSFGASDYTHTESQHDQFSEIIGR